MTNGIGYVILVSAYAGALLALGMRNNPGFASWHMFADLFLADMRLSATDAHGQSQPLNQWDYLPHSHLAMSLAEFKLFLFFLQRVHRRKANGTAMLHAGEKSFEATVKDGHVAS